MWLCKHILLTVASCSNSYLISASIALLIIHHVAAFKSQDRVGFFFPAAGGTIVAFSHTETSRKVLFTTLGSNTEASWNDCSVYKTTTRLFFAASKRGAPPLQIIPKAAFKQQIFFFYDFWFWTKSVQKYLQGNERINHLTYVCARCTENGHSFGTIVMFKHKISICRDRHVWAAYLTRPLVCCAVCSLQILQSKGSQSAPYPAL